jgi:hypothetical protein
MAHAVPERKPDGKGALTSGSGQTVEVQQLRVLRGRRVSVHFVAPLHICTGIFEFRHTL